MQVSCQCGFISLQTPTPEPLGVYHCHCTQCRKQTASTYGTSAIFPGTGLFPLSEPLKSKLKVWTRKADSGNTLDCYFCPECGVRVLHKSREKSTVSIKGGCIDGLKWEGAVHVWCRHAVVAIPEGVESYDEEPSSH